MSVSSIGGSSHYSAVGWAAKSRASENASNFEQVAAAASLPPIPSAYDPSWKTKNLSSEDKATITATTGIKFPPAGGYLVPMSASPNESYAMQYTIDQLTSQRGSFPKDLTSEDLLLLLKQNAPGLNPEPLADLYARRDAANKLYG